MTNPVPTPYRERIQSLESELNRTICGYPTEKGTPCRKWPVDDENRCSKHRGKDLQDAFQSGSVPTGESDEYTPETVQETPLRDPRDWKYAFRELARTRTYWIIVLLLGLVSGTAYSTFRTGISDQMVSAVEESPSLNVEDPDFNQIREWFRSGRYAMVRRYLNQIYENNSDVSSRAQALYYRYVLEQKLGNHETALSDAETFLQQFDDHTLRPEVLFGAWFLTHRLLDQPEQAEQYRKQLRSEYPESKWVQKINS